MASKTKLSVVIDFGTTKMVALAGYKSDVGKIEISGIAKTQSKGMKRGVIFNIEEVAASLYKLLADLQKQVDEKIEKVDVAYAGHQMKTIDFSNSKFTAGEGIVAQFDIDQLFNEAKKAQIDEGFQIIQVIPASYVVDGEQIEQNPVGITGQKIEVNYKLVVVPFSYMQNLQRVFDKVEIELGDVQLSTLAISESAINQDEKEMGVIILDIGAGTTKMAVFYENVLVHTAVIPFGGEVITRDIKEGCSILLKWAEQLKVEYGQALGDFADDQEMVTITGKNGWEPKEISFKSLAFIIQARLEEIIDSVYLQIEKSGVESQLGSGIVVTGGTSNLPNFISLVKFRTGMDARNANCTLRIQNRQKEIQHPEYLTALGMLSLMVNKTPENIIEKSRKKIKKKTGSGLSPWFSKVVQGVLDYVDDDNEDIALN